MLKISQLAKKAEVSVPTIKHYVNQGLLPKPVKTGKTMAYYNEACVERIRLIKKLQREKFLPLEVIKRMLDAEGPYEEEIELGKAIFKTDKLMNGAAPVPESQVARRTGFPLEKIRVLESEGLVFPAESESGKSYGSSDLRIIEMIRKREAMGVPFDHSVRIVRTYRDAMDRAVQEDLRLFAKSLLGDVSTRQAIRFMTEADESLDAFIVLYRHLLMRRAGEEALGRLNALTGGMELLNFLPLEGAGTPEGAGSGVEDSILGLFSGDFEAVLEAARSEGGASPWPFLAIVAALCLGRTDLALELASTHCPEPDANPLHNAGAALACMFALGRARGFSTPMYLAKRALTYLARLEADPGKGGVESLVGKYVLGGCFVMLPDFFDTVGRGTRILSGLASGFRDGKIRPGRVPNRLARIVDYEVLPAVEARVNLFYAEGLIRLGDSKAAAAPIERAMLIAGPSSKLSERARMLKLRIKK